MKERLGKFKTANLMLEQEGATKTCSAAVTLPGFLFEVEIVKDTKLGGRKSISRVARWSRVALYGKPENVPVCGLFLRDNRRERSVGDLMS